MYEVGSTFWLELFLLLSIVILLMISFNAVMRRWLGVKRPKLFSYNHVNDSHKKIDWSIRGTLIGFLLIGYFINIERLPRDPIVFLEPWFLLLIFTFASGIVQAGMERKYAKNPRAYILTISQLAFCLLLLVSLFTTDFWGFL